MPPLIIVLGDTGYTLTLNICRSNRESHQSSSLNPNCFSNLVPISTRQSSEKTEWQANGLHCLLLKHIYSANFMNSHNPWNTLFTSFRAVGDSGKWEFRRCNLAANLRVGSMPCYCRSQTPFQGIIITWEMSQGFNWRRELCNYFEIKNFLKWSVIAQFKEEL